MDHTPGDRLTDFTVRNLGFSDASELFVFISAYSAGMVYSSRAARDGLWAVAHRVWRRAAQIYLAHIVLLVTAALLAAQLTRVMGDPQFVQGMNIGPLLEQPGPTFLQALALLFQPTFMNILPLYIVLLAAFPLILWLIRRNAGMALGVSVLVWIACQEWPGLDNPYGTTWQFNPLAWQLLFVIGASLGSVASEGGSAIPRNRVLLAAAAAYAVAAFVIGARAWSYDGSSVALPPVLHVLLFPVMDRADLSLWRLADLLALAYVATYFLRAESAVLQWRVSRMVILCGQHSLTLFCVGVLLSIAGWAAFVEFGGRLAVQVAVNLAGFAIMVGIAWLLSRRSHTPVIPRAITPTAVSSSV